MDQAQLTEIERLSSALYAGVGNGEREEAQKQLLTLQSSVEHVGTCRAIIQNSENSYALIVAANSLEVLITKFWNNFSSEQKLETRNFVFTYLATRHIAENYIVGALAKLLCRITKLGWFDNAISAELREIVKETQDFAVMSTSHHLVGIKLLQALVDEMNTPTATKTLTAHRKTAVSFRDGGLFQAFQMALNTIKQVQSQVQSGAAVNGAGELNSKLINSAMQLSVACLSFDFIGTNPEESHEDVGTVQVPTSWRPIVQDCEVMKLFFEIYSSHPLPASKLALQGLVLMSSIRRSVFTNDKERSAFLECLMMNIERIMTTRVGLQEPENYHEFCRLLGRLKTCYQLSELVKISNFKSFLELAGNFTIMSFQSWQHSMNSIHYLLALWGRMVAALPYLRTDDSAAQSELLRGCVQQVAEAYTSTMLESAEVVVQSDGGVDDPLDDEGSLKEAMDRFPVIARAVYNPIVTRLVQSWEENLHHFVQGASMQPSPQVQQQMKVIEGRLIWLVTLGASIIGGPGTTADRLRGESHHGDNEMLAGDAKLCLYVFLLCKHMNERAASSGAKCDSRLETAILSFFKAFRKNYLLDLSAMRPSYENPADVARRSYYADSDKSTQSLMALMSIGGGKGGVAGADMAAVTPQQKLASSLAGLMDDAAYPGAVGGGGDSEGDTERTLWDHMKAIGGEGASDLSSPASAMNLMIDKLCSNIRYWHQDDLVLGQTLEVFVEFVTSYSNSKALLSLDAVKFLVHNHRGQNFPFLGYDSDNKHRTTFYSALARLVFSSSEDLDNLFDAFVTPNLDILQQLTQLAHEPAQLREPASRLAIIAALRDLRGITVSAYNKRTYTLLFEALHPGAFTLLRSVADVWYDDPVVVTALFKFLQEFVYNKGQRIYFDQSSANGILLFREASAIICSYGSRILQVPTKVDVYVEKYKGIRLMLKTLICCLGGGYVNFGVFELYGDQALQNALDVALQLCLQIPLEDVLTYVKLSRAYYGCIEIFFRNHLEVLSRLDAPIFLQLARCNLDGLGSTDATVITACTNTIDHIATYLFLNRNRGNKATVRQIQAHIQSDAEILPKLLSTLFNSLLFNTSVNQWPLTRPIFSLMLIDEQAFVAYQTQLLSTQSAENQDKLQGEFHKLTDNLQRSLDITARDRFTQRLTMFRMNVRNFLSL